MSPNEFRKLALALPETEERMHMRHPDFRVAGKIFATLAYPNKEWAMVKVTPIEQEMLVRSEPKVFSPVTGKWGLQGCTSVNLKAAKKTSLRGAIAAAWRLAAPPDVAQQTSAGSAAATMRKLAGKPETREQKNNRDYSKNASQKPR
jgi:hypothetical protein